MTSKEEKKLIKELIKNKKEEQKIINLLIKNIDKDEGCYEKFWKEGRVKAEPGYWALADLYIRQYLNNGGNGFGLKNVVKIYKFCVRNKPLLIKYGLVSADGNNLSGNKLWRNYDF